MGMYVFPIYVFAKWYIFFPVLMIFYPVACFKWKKGKVSRSRYCLTLSISAAFVFSVTGIILIREFNYLSILGTFISGFLAVFFSICLLTDNFERTKSGSDR